MERNPASYVRSDVGPHGTCMSPGDKRVINCLYSLTSGAKTSSGHAVSGIIGRCAVAGLVGLVQ